MTAYDPIAATGSPPQRSDWWRIVVAASGAFALVAMSAFVGGFLVFADHIANAEPPREPRADGIVALTGGPQRIDDAAELLWRGSARRLLISGVHEDTSGGALAQETPRLADLLDCCVDIGREAHDTRGNAVETRDWAQDRGYDSLIVVTAAYHMPRSLTEIRRELPGVKLVAFPINPERRDYASWPRDPRTFRLLVVEYAKYVVARLG